MKRHLLVLLPAVLGAVACEQDAATSFPGSTDWDRITVLAEASERVVEWLVAEGDRVHENELLLRLDGTRYDARIAQATARLAESEAVLAELVAGPRVQEIARARAELTSAAAAVSEADIEYDRVRELLDRALTSQSSVDQALAARDQRRAAVAAAEAVLDELLAGTRHEQIDQARARIEALQAELTELRLTRDRLDVRAPRSGWIDALPFKAGDQPRTGDPVASLLVGVSPIARIFIPASVRAGFSEGDAFTVRIEGIESEFPARLRSIRREASFTPYYALTGDDASRLVYRAELLIEADGTVDVPAGLPLTATPAEPLRGDE